MSWKTDFKRFDAFFRQFERDLSKKELSAADEQALIDNLNQVVEWGWKTLQDYDTNLKEETGLVEHNREDFAGNHALLRLKDLFENKHQIRSAHDVEYLRQNEWEIRAVIQPAFEELHEFFSSVIAAEVDN